MKLNLLCGLLALGLVTGCTHGNDPLQTLPIQKVERQQVNLIPQPSQLTYTGTAFLLHQGTQISAGPGLENEVAQLETLLHKALTAGTVKNQIILAIDSALTSEAYELIIDGTKLHITGGDAAGVFYGIQTLRQLLPAELAYGQVPTKAVGIELPGLVIKDQPLVKWRGVMVDSARHFQPKEFIMKFIDLMSVHKINRMHWHLVDSEGWRLEVKKYPKLHQVTQPFPAEYPSEDPTDKSRPAKYMYGHFHGGGYYTQEDIREIVAYAKKRHVTITPELAFPAHAMAMLTAYPEFSTTGKKPEVRSNISPALVNVDEKSLNFLRDILDEMMVLFPSEVIHFGGDEAPKGQWKQSAYVQEKIKNLGLKDEEQLQAWLFNEMAKHIAKQGRRPAGWEEIMHGHNMEVLTKSAIVMPWLSRANGIKSANNGYGVVHTGVGPFYLDSWQTTSPADNWALYRGPMTLAGIYNYNLFPNGLTEEGKTNILGAQCQLWSELMPKPEHMEYQAYPRLTALAELTWTQPEAKNYDNYYSRLLAHTARLDALNVNYRFVDPLPVTNWQAHADKTAMTVAIPTTYLAQAAEEVVIELRGTNRQALQITKVEILNNGLVYSVDEHLGKSDSNGLTNAYTVTLPAKAEAVNATIKLTYQSNPGSAGEIRIFKGRGKELFNPRNFAGGDYPTASWKKSEIEGTKHSVRIPMDGLIKAAGSYELVFDLVQTDAPVTINGLIISGSEGEISKSPVSGQLVKNGSQLILPLEIPEIAVKPGNSIFFTVNAAQPSEGNVRVRAIQKWTAKNATQWNWSPEVLKGANTAVYLENVTAKRDGILEANFRYTAGGHGLDIFNVQLVEAGQILAQDNHKGFTGGRPKENDYTLKSDAIKAGKTYQLRLSVNGSGGTNSHGEVTVK